MKFITPVLLVVFFLFAHLELRAQNDYQYTSAQRIAVNKVLKDSTGWRVANTNDCNSSSLSNWQKEKPGYSPYFACADFNGDDRKDFILGFIHEDRLSILYFLGQRNGYSSPRFLLTTDYYETCGIFIQGSRLLYGDFYTDNAVSYIWDSVSKKFQQEKLSKEECDY